MSKKFQTYTRPWIKRETVIDKKKRAARVVHTLEKSYPNAHMALQYRTRIQLLVAVMLSAQCTDKKVNEVTVPLFKTGFYRAKAKNIIAACKKIEADFSGRLPRAMAQILTLPGVARKTANVVLGNAYGVVDGIAVDTHVSRIAQRLGLTKNTSPEKIEQELMKLFPKKEWFAFTYRVINHGRAICEAKKPKCGTCLLRKLCPSALA